MKQMRLTEALARYVVPRLSLSFNLIIKCIWRGRAMKSYMAALAAQFSRARSRHESPATLERSARIWISKSSLEELHIELSFKVAA